jgi:hypothetical protein
VTTGKLAEARIGSDVALRDPEAVRQHVLDEGAREFCDGLLEALKRRHPVTGRVSERWAYLLFAKMAKLVGVQVDVAMLVIQSVGVPLPEAKRAVEQVRELEGLDEHQTAELMAGALARYLEAWPERWGEIATALGGPALGPHVAHEDAPGSTNGGADEESP